jgi:CheY-like chemotaxis protein
MMSAERILIVEDDDYLRKASEIALRRAGYTVISAPTGREGLNLARSEQPHLIILDLLMPQPTGLEILRTLRSEAATKATPIMVISNSSMQRVVDEVTGLGAEYIVKADLSLKELAGRVERKLASAAPQTPSPAAPVASPAAVTAAPTAKPAAPPPAPAQSRPAAPPVASKPLPGEEGETFECAGCGGMIGNRAAFCPKCGRPLTEARGGRGWRAETR